MQNAKELMLLATTDPLTGVLNRRSFLERGAIELERTRRYDRPMTVLMIDADHFKHVNDRFGHDGGDAVLIALTQSLSAGLRISDLLGRLGGEEFAILLPETGPDDAEMLADRLRTRVSELRVATKNGTATLTISVGSAAIDANTTDFSSLLERADKALYEAKKAGRNRVVNSLSTAAQPVLAETRSMIENGAGFAEKADFNS
jgi:diguanylate cyclase (GGDEF)-like protein